MGAFVGNMQADVNYKVADSDEVTQYKDFWLPLLRESLPEVPADAPAN